jgi:hypothetical protein
VALSIAAPFGDKYRIEIPRDHSRQVGRRIVEPDAGIVGKQVEMFIIDRNLAEQRQPIVHNPSDHDRALA